MKNNNNVIIIIIIFIIIIIINISYKKVLRYHIMRKLQYIVIMIAIHSSLMC